MAAAFAVVAMVMAVAVIAPTTSEVEEADGIVIEASLLAIGLVASVIYGAGVGTGWLIGEVTDPVAPASDQEEVYKQLRGLYSETLVSNMNTAKNLISSVMPADTSLWSFTTNYWNRATELSVADYWTMDNEYDANMMTEQAMLRQNVESYIYDWQAAVDSAYNNITQKHTKLTGDCYGDMAFSVVWSGDTYTADGSSTFGIDLLQVIDGTQSGTTVYIDGSTEDAGDNFNESTSGTIYVNGSNSVTLRYIDTGQTFSLHGGLNTVSNEIQRMMTLAVIPVSLHETETITIGLFRIGSRKIRDENRNVIAETPIYLWHPEVTSHRIRFSQTVTDDHLAYWVKHEIYKTSIEDAIDAEERAARLEIQMQSAKYDAGADLVSGLVSLSTDAEGCQEEILRRIAEERRRRGGEDGAEHSG